jgi:hypothetical protein
MERDMDQCPICKNNAHIRYEPQDDRHYIKCDRCKEFYISGRFMASIKTPSIEKGYAISNILRQRSISTFETEIDPITYKKLLANAELPSYKELLRNLILKIGKDSKRPEEISKYEPLILAWDIGGIDVKTLKYISEQLQINDVLRIIGDFNKSTIGFQLKFKGWDEFENILKSRIDGKYAFMAMEYNDIEIEKAFENCFKNAVEETGFELKVLRNVLKAGLIDNQLRIQIRNCKFLLADLSRDNNGAYWEAGYAEGLGKPVIYLCEKGKFDEKKTHFDTNHHTTVIWQASDFIGSKEQLKATIRSTLPLEAKMTD